MPTPLTDDERARILELQEAGESRNAIAREVGRSPGIVSKVVKAAGRTFDRGDQVAAATEARQQDNRAKRAALESDLLDDAIRLRQQLWQPATVYSFGGRDNTYASEVLPEPDASGKATILRAVGLAVDKSVKLSEVDRAAAGADEGRSIVGAFFDALGLTDSGTDTGTDEDEDTGIPDEPGDDEAPDTDE